MILSFSSLSPQQTETTKRALWLLVVLVVGLVLRGWGVWRVGEVLVRDGEGYMNLHMAEVINEGGILNIFNLTDPLYAPSPRPLFSSSPPLLPLLTVLLHRFLSLLHIPSSLLSLTAFSPPLFALLSSLLLFSLTTFTNSLSCGLLSSLFFLLSPTFLSHSLPGSFSNTPPTIFFSLLTLSLWLSSLKSPPSPLTTTLTSLSYLSLSLSSPLHPFILNLLSLHSLLLLFFYPNSSTSLPPTFTLFSFLTFPLLSLLSLPTPLTLFTSPLYFLPLLTLLFLFFSPPSPDSPPPSPSRLLVFSLPLVSFYFLSSFFSLSSSFFPPLFSSSLLSSLSHHQPTTWASFFYEYSLMLFFVLPGVYICLKEHWDSSSRINTLLLLPYLLLSFLLSSLFSHFLLFLTPPLFLLSSLGFTHLLSSFLSLAYHLPPPSRTAYQQYTQRKQKFLVVVVVLVVIVILSLSHFLWLSPYQYPSPTTLLEKKHHFSHSPSLPPFPQLFHHHHHHQQQHFLDDLREGYKWLETNLPPSPSLSPSSSSSSSSSPSLPPTIFSWWDHGSPLTVLSKKNIFCDNNFYNFTEISRVGGGMVGGEERGREVVRQGGREGGEGYVVVFFGGGVGWGGDDMGKMVWMVRVGREWDTNIIEEDYFSPSGRFSVGKEASCTLSSSLLYKLSYYRFAEHQQQQHQQLQQQQEQYKEEIKEKEEEKKGEGEGEEEEKEKEEQVWGYDWARKEYVKGGVELEYFEEVFSSKNLVVRVYRVLGEEKKKEENEGEWEMKKEKIIEK